MKKGLLDFLNGEQGKALSKNLTGIMFAVFAFQISMFVTGLVFKKSAIIVHVISFLLIFLAYMLFKDNAEEGTKKISLHVVKFGTVLFVGSVVNHLFFNGLEAIASEGLRAEMTKVMLFLDLAVIIGFAAFLNRESSKEVLEKLEDTSIPMLLNGGAEEIVEGDAVLGQDVDTKKPVVLPLKDRYLHMLILGPTGSGKTSQTIIPMIHRDMQNPDMGITVIEPKGDLAEKIYAMADYYGREVEYFNPLLKDCPYFNPLYGDETDSIENIVTTFKMLDPDSPQFFQNHNEVLIRNGMKVIKRLHGDDATLLHLDTLVHNTGGGGEQMVKDFMKLTPPNESTIKENRDIATWFLTDYFTGAKGSRTATKTYEHTSGVRNQIMKIVSNTYLRKVLNPPVGHGSDVNFDRSLAEGKIIAICTAQGKLRDLGKFLGYFIILQLQASVFRRPGNENTRRGNMLYIDEFQVYSNPGFEDMLTQGRSYRVASHLATQTRALIGRGGQAGKDFLEVVSTNARNLVIYPGGSKDDAQYYEALFGEEEETTVQKGISRQKFSVLSLFSPFKPEQESIRETVETKARFSATDIINQPFGRIFHRLIKNNSVQLSGISQIEYIPKELNDLLDQMVADYNEDQLAETETIDVTPKAKAVPRHKKAAPVVEEQVVVDPLSLLGDEDVDLVDEGEDDNYIFIDEKENTSSRAKTQSDVIDLEDEDVFEF